MGYEPSCYAPNGGHLCGQCGEMPPAFVRATAFGAYELLSPVLRLFKFEGVRALEKPLGEMLAEAIVAQAEGMPERLLVVPVPLFGRRHRMYNQSELLARGAVRVVRRRHPEWQMEVSPRCMRRVHHRESHYRLSPEERRENVRGAFRVRGDVSGRDVLLVDDVYTTGATVAECTETLLAAGGGECACGDAGPRGHPDAGALDTAHGSNGQHGRPRSEFVWKVWKLHASALTPPELTQP